MTLYSGKLDSSICHTLQAYYSDSRER